MLTFSLKQLLVAMFLASIACLTLVRPGIGMARVMMLAVTLSMLVLAVAGVRTRRPVTFVLAFLSMGYLAIADGGILPSAERYLPPEWGLERCCQDHTAFDCGLRRSTSLTKWGLAVGPNHKDWRYVTQPKSKTDSKKGTPPQHQPVNDFDLEALLDLVQSSPSVGDSVSGVSVSGVSVRLPVITPVKVTSVHISRKRDLPQNRSFFIVGHCLIVTLTLMVATIHICAVSKRARAAAIG